MANDLKNVGPETTEALHFDEGKLPLQDLPWHALQYVAEVLRVGAEKYGKGNWEKGMPWSKLHGSALRHITEWSLGEDHDDDTGLPHLAHAVTNLLFLLDYQIRGVGTDNRRMR